MSAAHFIGVYSSISPGSKKGRASTKGKRYWFIWDCDDAGYRIQALDGAFRPHGDPLTIDPATFRASFSPEPSIFAAPLRQGPFPASPSRQQEEVSPAKTSEQSAAEQAAVEKHLRGHFGVLLSKIQIGDDLPGALKALQDIAEVEEGIVPEHKHMFAEFGINLRKGKLPEIALAHAKRVLSLAPGDSHAHFNIARIYHALGKLGEAEQHLLTALEFSPEMEYAKDFLAHIAKERRLKGLGPHKKPRR